MTTTLHGDVVKPLLRRFGWDETPPFSALVLSEEVECPTPGPDMILESMKRCGVVGVHEVAKTEDLLHIWALPKPLDTALDDEIAKVVRG